MKKLLLTLSVAALFGLAACGPGGSGSSPTTSGAPRITGPLTTGDPGSSLPLSSPSSEESMDMDDDMDGDDAEATDSL